ncbi:hypothetical protein FRB97_009647 [Tulasnella sp. 331]|nr:hypothetical protein FRB97_009647 [Tulasnella sp. 331]
MHHKYYDELIDLAVGDATYRVSKSLLCQSTSFSEAIGSHPGGQPISPIGVTVFEMDSLLDVLHARQTEAPLQLTIQEWGSALHLATKWGFVSVREHIIKHIESNFEDQEALDRFELAMKCHVPQWLHPAYDTLCTRSEHITADEGRRLGYERLTAICKIREIFRSESRKAVADGRCGECKACRGIECYGGVGSTISRRKPCKSPPGVAKINALQWISEDEHLKAYFPEVEKDIAVAFSIAPKTGMDEKLKDRPSNMATALEAVYSSSNIVSRASHATFHPDAPIAPIDPKVTDTTDTSPPPTEPTMSSKKGNDRKDIKLKKKECPMCAELRRMTGAEKETCACQIVALLLGHDAKANTDYHQVPMTNGVSVAIREREGISLVPLASGLETILVTIKSSATAVSKVVPSPSRTVGEGLADSENRSLNHVEVINKATTETTAGVEVPADIHGRHALAESSALSSKTAIINAEPKTASTIVITGAQNVLVRVGTSSEGVKEFLSMSQDSDSDSGWSL